jgi:hypothetical protein
MDNVRNCDIYVNIPSPQTYRTYLQIMLYLYSVHRKCSVFHFLTSLQSWQFGDLETGFCAFMKRKKFGFSWMAWIVFILHTEPRRDRYSIALSFPPFIQTMQIDIKKPAWGEEINIMKAFPPSAPALESCSDLLPCSAILERGSHFPSQDHFIRIVLITLSFRSLRFSTRLKDFLFSSQNIERLGVW